MVFAFDCTDVLNIVAVSFIVAAAPNIVLSVIVNEAVPVPDTYPDILTISPAAPVPLGSKIVTV